MAGKQLHAWVAGAALVGAVLAGTLASPAAAQGWQNGVWTGAGWAWQGGPEWRGNWKWRRGSGGPGWGGFYPGPAAYPFGFPYGYAYPYTARGYYGCYRPIPVPGTREFVREQVC
jgi:hypothetical protein